MSAVWWFHIADSNATEGKMGPALRVDAEKTPCGVIRHSFGATKPRSFCLAWCHLSVSSGIGDFKAS